MIRVLLAAFALSASLSGQLTLSPAAPITFPTVYATDISEIRLTLSNAGNQGVTIATLSIAGTAFSIPDSPAIPRQLGPGESLSFLVRFAPADAGSFSAVLQAGSLTAFVLGKSLAGPNLSVGGLLLHASDAIDFGSVEKSAAVSRHFTLTNPLTRSLTIAAVTVTGGFGLAGALATPLTLAPGESLGFDIAAPTGATGTLPGSLSIDGRAFPLTVSVTEHPPPIPKFVFSDSQVKSAQHSKLSIALSEPARAAASGSVEFAFELLTNGLAGDPGVLFPATGTRSIGFTVEPGDTSVRFGNTGFADFQTGTTAGNLVFRIRFGAFLDTATLAVAPDVPGFDQIRAARTSSGIDVDIAGFDNTQSASKLAFTFFGTDGTPVNTAAIPVDAAEAFRAYFQSSGLGGVFSLKASFPVSGGTDRISGVQVDLVNSQGTAHSAKTTF